MNIVCTVIYIGYSKLTFFRGIRYLNTSRKYLSTTLIASMLNVIHQILCTNRDLSTRSKMAVYNAICVSTLFYACEGWTPYRRHIRAFEAFHIRCLQTILYVHWWDKIPHVEIRHRAGTTCLETILLRRQLRWLGHVIRIPGNRLPRRLLYSELSCGRCSVGGQKKRFKDHIKSSLSKCGIPSDRLEELAGDRKNGVQFATRCWQHLNSNILMWQ